MTLTDGAIMFIGCVLAFAIGYTIGAVRVGMYVNKRLEEIRMNVLNIEKHSKELRQIYAKLEEGEPK